MQSQEILDRLLRACGDAVGPTDANGPWAAVAPDRLRAVALFLRDEDALCFDSLMCLSGTDPGGGLLGVVYHLHSMRWNHKLTLRVQVPREHPHVPSVESVWKTATWHEREAYDLLGVVFDGHPDLRRILLPDDWEGHPLRKDYQVPEYYNGMKVPS
ncbi:MAG: NADH-quinone oxidoreductase subunit C [Bacteroidota bacterium]